MNNRNPAGATLLRLAAIAVLALPGAASAQDGASLEELRERALELVNADRAENGLPALEAGPVLDDAAIAHAEDMLARDYYGHHSPEGESVVDRYVEAGGSRWELVAENLSQCTGCVPSLEVIEDLQQGWMESPEHRENIVAEGLERFGFGLASESGTLYAVQTFAGPGTPRGLKEGEETRAVSADEQGEILLAEINAARREEGLSPLEPADDLGTAARELLPEPSGEFELTAMGDIGAALPDDEPPRWARFAAVSGACGGCGAEATEADIVFFAEDWLQDPNHRMRFLSSTFTHLGFALAANGEGKKIALAVLGQAR
jgi:uncharacterized protein YkwD